MLIITSQLSELEGKDHSKKVTIYAVYGCNVDSGNHRMSILLNSQNIYKFENLWIQRLTRGRTATTGVVPSSHSKIGLKHFEDNQFLTRSKTKALYFGLYFIANQCSIVFKNSTFSLQSKALYRPSKKLNSGNSWYKLHFLSDQGS